MSEDRAVHTDALKTLGTVIGESERRDAIHLAVEPVIAGERLYCGQHVGILDGKANTKAKHVGVVDPFLKEGVEIGQRFWLVVYPRTITSLRHVWSHPDFADIAEPQNEPADSEVAKSQAWIAQFAAKIDQTPNRLMDAAQTYLEYDDYTRDDSESYKGQGAEMWREFWRHYAVVTGKPVEDGKDDSFFTCSC